MAVTIDDVRAVAEGLPRSYEVLVRGRVEFPSDLRFTWLEVRLAALERDELRELVLDAWRMVVPKRVARGHLGG